MEAVFRLQKNMTVEMDRFMDSERIDSIIEVKPRPEIRARIHRRHAQAKCPPLKLRLVKYTIHPYRHHLHARCNFAGYSALHQTYLICTIISWGIEVVFQGSQAKSGAFV